MIRKTVLLAFAVISCASVVLYFWKRHSVSREDLGIAPQETAENCTRASLPFYHPYNQELAANDYLLYAVASLNAYEDPEITRFVVERFDPTFKEIKMGEHNNLHYKVYLNDGDKPQVIVAFRGTRLGSVADWIANLSWITGLLPISTAYDAARPEFRAIRALVKERLGDRDVGYVTTGHSLGGGIAQHIAYGFPCVSAVVFDTSFVTNAYYYKQPYEPVTVHLHDRGDELTKLRRTFWAEEDSERYRWYPLDLVPLGRMKHEIMRFAVGMAGMTTNCQLGAPSRCQIPATDTKAQNLYCPTFGVRDRICQPVLDRLKPRG